MNFILRKYVLFIFKLIIISCNYIINIQKVCWKCGNFLKIFKASRTVQCSCDKEKHDRDANATFSIFSVFLSIATLGYRPAHFTSANPKPTKKPPDRQQVAKKEKIIIFKKICF